MDKSLARQYLGDLRDKAPSEVGEVVDVLLEDYSSYDEMARDLSVGKEFLRRRHCVFQLPRGIRWKIDARQISFSAGYQISRLKDEADQWLLAFVIVEERLEGEVCENVVRRVQKHNDSIRTALTVAAGIQFDKVVPLLLPLGFEIRLAMSQKAWNQHKEVQDFCFSKICEGAKTDRENVKADLLECANELRVLLSKLDGAISTLADY